MNTKTKKSTGMLNFVAQPRPGGYLKIKMDVKEKIHKQIQFNQYHNIINHVEVIEKDQHRIEKTIVKNPIPPTITSIRNLNLPKISQESLFDKFIIEDEDNGENQMAYELWLSETAPAKDLNLMENLEEAISFIVQLAINSDTKTMKYDEMQAISVIQFLRTIKTPSGQYEANNQHLMEYIDKIGEEYYNKILD